ncbi:MAG TPA: efflux RND transporter periplasmic adaptor subunit [Tepidisphaeraceae bacterium]|jgi:HlyD family secretion protein
MLTWIKRLVVVVVLLALVGGAGMWYWGGKAAAPVQFRTAKIERDDLVASISATGTVEPDEVIDVGSQVTGQIVRFGTDADGKQIDYHSRVTAGSLIAQIDDTTYTASLNEAKAQLLAAQAGIQRAQADKLTAQAKLSQASNDWKRAERIGPGDALAQTTYDTYKSTYDQGQAAVAVADAAMATARAQVDQAESAVKRAQRNVDYCTIRSPVDGVVIDRRINIGQTVVSTQSASSLFLVARDLSTMQVWVAVNEADVGHIKVGQPVTFTCDAFGDRVFKGAVKKMRLNAQMTQNVVVYTVEVTTDNADLTLIPYLTANVQFETERQNDTLMVPNAALRWMPTTPEQIVPEQREQYAVKDDDASPGGGGGPRGGPPGGGNRGDGNRGDGNRGGEGREGRGGRSGNNRGGPSGVKSGLVWVKAGQFVKAMTVTTGVSDGAYTAVTGEGLTEGAEVIAGTIALDASGQVAQGPTNPFLPQMRRGGPGGGGGGGGGRGPR